MKGAFSRNSMGYVRLQRVFRLAIFVDTYLGEKCCVLCLPNSTNIYSRSSTKALHKYGPKIEHESSERIGLYIRKFIHTHVNSTFKQIPGRSSIDERKHVDTYKGLKEKENALKKNKKERCENTEQISVSFVKRASGL